MANKEKELLQLLEEAIKIIHCHNRGLHKDWLQRARKLKKEIRDE